MLFISFHQQPISDEEARSRFSLVFSALPKKALIDCSRDVKCISNRRARVYAPTLSSLRYEKSVQINSADHRTSPVESDPTNSFRTNVVLNKLLCDSRMASEQLVYLELISSRHFNERGDVSHSARGCGD